MKILSKIIFGILFISISIYTIQAQIWPYSPMIRFGNTIYYPIDSISANKLKDTNLSFGKEIENRYIDFIILKDSIGIKLCDSIVYFRQKPRKEPKCYKEILFYKKRNLQNTTLTVNYIKMLDYNEKEILAQACLIRKNNRNKYKRKENISIKIEDINGIFLGPSREYRCFLTGIGIGSISLGLILFL